MLWVRSMSSLATRLSAKLSAARIGPTVCELDGPMPTRNMSKTLSLPRRFAMPAVYVIRSRAKLLARLWSLSLSAQVLLAALRVDRQADGAPRQGQCRVVNGVARRRAARPRGELGGVDWTGCSSDADDGVDARYDPGHVAHVGGASRALGLAAVYGPSGSGEVRPETLDEPRVLDEFGVQRLALPPVPFAARCHRSTREAGQDAFLQPDEIDGRAMADLHFDPRLRGDDVGRRTRVGDDRIEPGHVFHLLTKQPDRDQGKRRCVAGVSSGVRCRGSVGGRAGEVDGESVDRLHHVGGRPGVGRCRMHHHRDGGVVPRAALQYEVP